MKFFVIGDEDTVAGFRLAGVEGRQARTLIEVREAFQVAVATPDVGVILIAERLAQQIREQVNQYIYENEFPLVLEIPDRQGSLPGKKSIAQMINEAVGIRV